MKERGILFSAPMVQALLEGRKSQTRRIIKPQPPSNMPGDGWPDFGNGSVQLKCPYGQAGDRLWVKETWLDLHGTGIEYRNSPSSPACYAYAADALPGSVLAQLKKHYGLKWRPSIYMPRAASRLTLQITNVRAERLQQIDEADSQAEGVHEEADGKKESAASYRAGYRKLWDAINGAGSWDTNPWVWVVQFELLPTG